MGFLREAFSDNGAASSSRIMTALHSLCAMGLLISFSYHNHGALPEVAVVAGLGGFATVHYAVNRFSQGVGQKGTGGVS